MGLDTLGILFARRLFHSRRMLRLHQARGPLDYQRLEVDAVDDVERIEHVTLGFRHLLAALIENEPGDVHIAERHVAHELQTHHHHPGHPEEDDVEARYQHAGGIQLGELGGLIGPPECGERPQCR